MFAKSALFLTLAGTALAQLMIQTPASLIQCQPALLSWSGGSGPYFLAAIPGGQSSAAALKDFGSQTGTSYTWNVDLPAGTSITLKLTDSSGQINYNQAVTIQEGSDSSCLNASGSGAAAGSMSMMGGAASSASGAASSAASSASMAVTSAAGAMSSAGGMSSAMSSASGGFSSVRAAASTGAASATSAGASRAASTSSAAASSGAAFALQADVKNGALAVLIGAMGLAWL